MTNHQPIGIFDSGVGGLSIAKCLNQVLPYEQLIYLADHKHLPYGTKSPEFLIQRSIEVCSTLINQGAKAIVVACNTATSHTISELRKNFSCPIFGIEPGIKPAAEQSVKKHIGVMATTQTLESDSFKSLLKRYELNVHFFCQACKGLAHSIETHGPEAKETQALLKKYLDLILRNQIDTLVLGCTHYSHIQSQIESILGKNIHLIEPSLAVTKHIKNTLKQKALLNLNQVDQRDIYLTNHRHSPSFEMIHKLWKSELETNLVD